MTTPRALVDIADYAASSPPLPASTTVIGVVGGSLATHSAKQLPKDATLPPLHTPTLITSLTQAREVFGWLTEPSDTFNGKSYTGTWADHAASPNGTGTGRKATSTLIRAFEGIYSTSSPICVAVRIDDTKAAGATRATEVNKGLTALRDNNATGIHPTIVICPEEFFEPAASGYDIKKPAILDTFTAVCKDLGAIGLVQMPPIDVTDAVGSDGNSYATNTASSNSPLWRVYPNATPDFQTDRFDITPNLASALAAADSVGLGLAANPRSVRLLGVTPNSPAAISHSATSATVHSALLRAKNICPIVNAGRGVQPLGTILARPVSDNSPDRFVNVFRVKEDIKRNFARLAEEATELNANKARQFLVQQGNALMSAYEGLGWLTAPTVQVDPERDAGGNSPDVHILITYRSVQPAQFISLRVGPNS